MKPLLGVEKKNEYKLLHCCSQIRVTCSRKNSNIRIFCYANTLLSFGLTVAGGIANKNAYFWAGSESALSALSSGQATRLKWETCTRNGHNRISWALNQQRSEMPLLTRDLSIPRNECTAALTNN